MESNFEDLINTTYTSSRKSLEGHYFYDSIKKAWFKVIKSCFVFVSFQYSFGARWPTHHHNIIEVEKCSKKKSDYLLGCCQTEYHKLRA